jgi:hypothetical protein
MVPRDLAAARRALANIGVNIGPEQIDLYQLGALLCHRFIGGPPGDCLDDMTAGARLPPDLRDLLARALGRPPEARFADAADLAAEAADLLQRRRELPFARLGPYLLLVRIGRGGMGEVYKAYDPALKRPVALKVLPEALADRPEFVARFRAEAAAAARLDHPNVVHVYFTGVDRGRHYFVMQLVAGETLADRLARGRLGVAEALLVAEQVVAGLQAAHELGLVHRDVKPRNILLDGTGRRALVADFGLVKYLNSPGDLTGSGMVLGTVQYIAPEQGQGLTVDGRTDLYAVGVVLFRMLSGRLPFETDSSAAMIYHHIHVPPPDLDRVAPDVPPALARLVARLLAKSPADRYQSAGNLLADLRVIRTGAADSRGVSPPRGPLPPVKGSCAGSVTATVEGSDSAAAWAAPGSGAGNAAPVGAGGPVGVRGAGTAAAWRGWLAAVAAVALAALGWALLASPAGMRLTGRLPHPPGQVLPLVPNGGPPPAPRSPDAEAADWLLRLGGTGQAVCQGRRHEVSQTAGVPPDPFRLTAIHLTGNKQVTVADLAQLPAPPELTELNLSDTPVSDAGLRALPPLPALQVLNMGLTGVTDAGLEVVGRLTGLTALNLDGTAITDAGLSRLERLTHLEQLAIANTRVGDAGLRTTRAMTRLIELGLNGTGVTDAGLESFTGLQFLTHLHLARTAVGDDGLRTLRRLRRLQQLDLRGTRVSGPGAAAFRVAVPGCTVHH